jgi:hypothetical protein
MKIQRHRIIEAVLRIGFIDFIVEPSVFSEEWIIEDIQEQMRKEGLYTYHIDQIKPDAYRFFVKNRSMNNLISV